MPRIKINDNFRNLINYIDSLSDVPDVDRSWRTYVQFALDYDCFKEFALNYYLLRDLYQEKIKQIEENERKQNKANYI